MAYQQRRWTEDGVSVVNVGNTDARIGEKSYICSRCGLGFKESDIRWYEGQPFGIPCGCHKDIPSLIRRKRENGT